MDNFGKWFDKSWRQILKTNLEDKSFNWILTTQFLKKLFSCIYFFQSTKCSCGGSEASRISVGKTHQSSNFWFIKTHLQLKTKANRELCFTPDINVNVKELILFFGNECLVVENSLYHKSPFKQKSKKAGEIIDYTHWYNITSIPNPAFFANNRKITIPPQEPFSMRRSTS